GSRGAWDRPTWARCARARRRRAPGWTGRGGRPAREWRSSPPIGAYPKASTLRRPLLRGQRGSHRSRGSSAGGTGSCRRSWSALPLDLLEPLFELGNGREPRRGVLNVSLAVGGQHERPWWFRRLGPQDRARGRQLDAEFGSVG